MATPKKPDQALPKVTVARPSKSAVRNEPDTTRELSRSSVSRR